MKKNARVTIDINVLEQLEKKAQEEFDKYYGKEARIRILDIPEFALHAEIAKARAIDQQIAVITSFHKGYANLEFEDGFACSVPISAVKPVSRREAK